MGAMSHTREMPVTVLNASTRVAWCLRAAKIETLGQLSDYPEAQLLKIKHFGRLSLEEVRVHLGLHGLPLGGRVMELPEEVTSVADWWAHKKKVRSDNSKAARDARGKTIGELRREIATLKRVNAKLKLSEATSLMAVARAEIKNSELIQRIAKQNKRIGMLDERIQNILAHFEQCWAECHDGSEHACSKVHDNGDE